MMRQEEAVHINNVIRREDMCVCVCVCVCVWEVGWIFRTYLKFLPPLFPSLLCLIEEKSRVALCSFVDLLSHDGFYDAFYTFSSLLCS